MVAHRRVIGVLKPARVGITGQGDAHRTAPEIIIYPAARLNWLPVGRQISFKLRFHFRCFALTVGGAVARECDHALVAADRCAAPSNRPTPHQGRADPTLAVDRVVREEISAVDARQRSLTCADGRLYCYGQKEGACVLIEASPKGWKEGGRLKIPKQTTIRADRGGIWTHPVVANGRLYLRDQDLIFCYDVKEGK